MIQGKLLRDLAKVRLEDARVLSRQGRFDGAAYIVGYAVELALKARICKTLGWPAFPESRGEFQDLQSFKTHNLAVLLRLSGMESKVKTLHFQAWSAVENWSPESRYKPLGSTSLRDVQLMIAGAETLLKIL